MVNKQQQQQQQQQGWRSTNLPDWMCLDPAIVSSGQAITDSRSDSPPHWLRSLEQLTESTAAAAAVASSSSSTNNISSSSTSAAAAAASSSAAAAAGLFGLQSAHYGGVGGAGGSGGGLPSLAALGRVPANVDGLGSMGSFWPPSVSHSTPSMPPPGFSHIRPATKTADAQKIDNL